MIEAKPFVVAVAGPTASGKSALAMELCRRHNGELISCDSMQIYRRMDIGTAKPSAAERSEIPHHLIDICEPTENFSAAAFASLAAEAIHDILRRGKLPVLCGGTGLYLLGGLVSLFCNDLPVCHMISPFSSLQGLPLGLDSRAGLL